MSLNFSTEAIARLLSGSSFASIFGNGCIKVYSGTQPLTADAEVAGTLLASITVDGAAFVAGSGVGLDFIASGRYVLKDTLQTWILDGVTTGTAAWFRLTGNAVDSGIASIELPRLDGGVSTIADPFVGLILPTLAITSATSREVQQFIFTL